jgi:hypothetical protein
MILTGRVRTERDYNGGSKFEFWKNLKKGTILKVRVELQTLGKRGGMYSPDVFFSYKEDGELKSFRCSWGNATNYLKVVS